MLPFSERKVAVSLNQEKLRTLKYQYSSGTDLNVGNKVCLRSSPVYSTGAKAVHIKGSKIQCGVLMEDVISPTLSEKCQFKPVPPNDPSEDIIHIGLCLHSYHHIRITLAVT